MQSRYSQAHKSQKNKEFEELAANYFDTMQDELRKFLKSLKVSETKEEEESRCNLLLASTDGFLETVNNFHKLIHEMRVHALKHLNTKEKKDPGKDKEPSVTTEMEITESKAKLKKGIRELLKEIERFESKTICQHSLTQ